MEEEKHDAILGYKKQSKLKSLNVDELNTLNPQDLIEKIRQLEAHNTHLKNLLKKKCEEEIGCYEQPIIPKYDFTSCPKRHVFLKLYYLGWDYQGFVIQENTSNTVENHLFKALQKCCLIDKRETSNYNRCGRTDKGVSAFAQVISIDLRSKLDNPTAENCDSELPYVSMLNRVLPDNIRCYAWAHVGSEVSARFDCTSRTYVYYFPKSELNISLMKEAAKHLVGEHDFRNFCKMDISRGVIQFIRKINSIDIKPCSNEDSDFAMYKFIIEGNSFLWHQIRYIMAVLILIGQGRESPDIIHQLLDVNENPNKPQYIMADHLPLTLFTVDYENIGLRWNVNKTSLEPIVRLLQRQCTEYSIKFNALKEMLGELLKLNQSILNEKCQVDNKRGRKTPKAYKPLLTRKKCESLENRLEHFVKKRKLIKTTENDETLQTPSHLPEG